MNLSRIALRLIVSGLVVWTWAGCTGGHGGASAAEGSGGEPAPAGSAGGSGSGGLGGSADARGNGPSIVNPGAQAVDEEETLRVRVDVDDGGAGDTRVFAMGLPPGARWNERTRELVFTPDFTQGGGRWTVDILARNASGAAHEPFSMAAIDTIQPPGPTLRTTEQGPGYERWTVDQTTDAYLDSPGYAGRTLTARIDVPEGASASNRMPVLVYLHGYGAAPDAGTPARGQFAIYPQDPMNSYWWGYAESLPGVAPPTGEVPNYTQRRVLHLLDWVLRTHEGADPDRVYVTGGSMGGAGAAALGLLYARHFALVESTMGQMVARNHRPSRMDQLEGLWGPVGLGRTDGTTLEDGTAWSVWDRQDMCRVLRDWPEARDQFVMTKHGKDDPTIHFGAVTQASPVTHRSFYETLQQLRVGHYAVWDEGGHGSSDPVMGERWWDGGWNRMLDGTTYLRRDLPFPAFTAASHDWDPGNGTGNGSQTWSEEAGYAGAVAVPGDTGWTGDVAGVLNRFLRWDANSMVDEVDRFEISLFVADGEGRAAPEQGYPSRGDQVDKELPVTVDVTPRRVRGFRCLPGERVNWSYGGRQGQVRGNQDGSVTVPQLSVGKAFVRLILQRATNGAPPQPDPIAESANGQRSQSAQTE